MVRLRASQLELGKRTWILFWEKAQNISRLVVLVAVGWCTATEKGDQVHRQASIISTNQSGIGYGKVICAFIQFESFRESVIQNNCDSKIFPVQM